MASEILEAIFLLKKVSRKVKKRLPRGKEQRTPRNLILASFAPFFSTLCEI